MAVLGPNRYGKSGIRLVRVARRVDRHDLTDLTVNVWLEGDFDAAHRRGDNAAILPTDTMRATVYALASDGPIGEPEAFGLRLAGRFLEAAPAATRAQVELTEHAWGRIPAGAVPSPHAFQRVGGGVRTATVTGTRSHAQVTAGVADLTVLKSAGSAFAGFLRDEFTTLTQTGDRILATTITAAWDYTGADLDWRACTEQAQRCLLETFATHDSQSLQHTLFAMGRAVLEAQHEIGEIRLSMPNRHHLLVDLAPYGRDNPNEVFVAADRPFGVIEGTVRRQDLRPA